MKDKLSPTGRCIDVLLKGLKPHSPVMKLGHGVDEVSEGASKPVKPPDNEGISFSQVAESLCKAYLLLFGHSPQFIVKGNRHFGFEKPFLLLDTHVTNVPKLMKVVKFCNFDFGTGFGTLLHA